MEVAKKILSQLGLRVFNSMSGFTHFLGGSFSLLLVVIRKLFTKPFYPALFLEQCYLLGVKSFSLIFITSISTGFVMTLQFGLGLERFGGKLYVPKVVGLSIMRELGPVLGCLMLAGRVGSGIAAEIGSMNVTQQIDAIRALGADPIKKIVIPRFLALILVAPLLTIVADFVGIYSGMILASNELNIHPDFFFQNAVVSLRTTDFTVGIGKSLFFGVIIAITGCYYGLTTQGGTQGVGQSTTRAVVTSSILIAIADFLLTKLFWVVERGLYG